MRLAWFVCQISQMWRRSDGCALLLAACRFLLCLRQIRDTSGVLRDRCNLCSVVCDGLVRTLALGFDLSHAPDNRTTQGNGMMAMHDWTRLVFFFLCLLDLFPLICPETFWGRGAAHVPALLRHALLRHGCFSRSRPGPGAWKPNGKECCTSTAAFFRVELAKLQGSDACCER